MFALLASLAGTAALASEPAQGKKKPSETKQAESIDTGFFFMDGAYVPHPYRVEARGHELFINNILVRRALTFPADVLAACADPGPDPPAGTLPWSTDPAAEDYWRRKAVYLYRNEPPQQAMEKLIEAFKKCGDISNIERAGCPVYLVRCFTRSGWREVVSLESYVKGPDLRRSELRGAHEMAFVKGVYARALRDGQLIMRCTSGFERVLGSGQARRLLEVLLSDQATEDKVRAAIRSGLMAPDDRWSRDLVERFRPDGELAARFRELTSTVQPAPRFGGWLITIFPSPPIPPFEPAAMPTGEPAATEPSDAQGTVRAPSWTTLLGLGGLVTAALFGLALWWRTRAEGAGQGRTPV